MTLGRRDLAAVMVLLAATLAYALVVVKDFSGALVNVDDTNALEHLGYMMEENLTLGVVPFLRFAETKAMMYPFGTLVVFLPWGVERDLLYVLCHKTFGEGPWLQLYQAASVAISSIGTYFLLRREEGRARALLVGAAGTFMNFYAVYKYPHHMNVSTMHWAILSVVVDFMLFRRLVRGDRWSARLVLARVVLLLLVFGLDLGYVTGFALTSFTVTFAVAIAWAVRHGFRHVLPKEPLAELRAHPATTALLGALLFVAVWLYIPIVAQIVLATRKYPFSGPGGSFWASQFRLLFPYLPFVGPQSDLALRIFGTAEGIGEFSTGWALLALVYLGLRDARRRRELLIYAPILIAFVLCFVYHPRRVPSLRIFPWFQFNRVAGRATLLFPIWCSLIALAWRPDLTVARVRRWIAGIGVFAAIETVTAYAAFRYDVFAPNAGFWSYMKTVREAPGEAVLDWPFCISGGNGVATHDLCPYYALTSTTYAYRRFHKKDVVGLLLSRMTEGQVKPFYDLELPRLFAPDDPEIRTSRRQTRCFDDRDWQIFDGFYKAHPFAGINLYPDLLPPGCPEQFFERYGKPVAETRLPAEGRALFLRRR